MGLSSRSVVAIHALTMLARWDDRSLTSAEIADSLASNSVLVRRILGSLRQADLVWSTEGHGGGWSLARAPQKITRTPPSRKDRSCRGTPTHPATHAKSDATSADCSRRSSKTPDRPWKNGSVKR